MARYRRYIERDSVDILIIIPDDESQPCTVETRYAGHSQGIHVLSREAAERCIDNYGFVEVDESLIGN